LYYYLKLLWVERTNLINMGSKTSPRPYSKTY
jgi:hypothetical protein